ncbi:hypothetical protein [Chitinilyticum litopenaei]|uniref:hypothetical protein n=1 Tax=Chitinilyticum litopenaei TaxID=1121276 RepID=UPI00130DB7BE|nr:hypothetical protein [Chitinilyticum litopenaei]
MIPFEPLRAAIVDARAQIAALVVLKMLPCIIFEQVVEQLVAAGELAVELLLLGPLAGVVLALVSRLRIKQVAGRVEGEGFLAQAAGGGEQPV